MKNKNIVLKMVILVIGLSSSLNSKAATWPAYSCDKVVYQISPSLSDWLNGGTDLRTDIELTWIAGNPVTQEVYLKGSPEKVQFKMVVDQAVSEASNRLNVVIKNYQFFGALGAASITFKSEDRKSVREFICALPNYAIIANLKGEVKIKGY